MAAKLAVAPEPVARSFEITALVRYSDALEATLSQCWRRAPGAVSLYLAVLAGLAAAAWLTAGALAWLAVMAALPGLAAAASAAWLARLDFKRSGGKPVRMRYRVCSSGIEIDAARRCDWIAWEDLWGASETRRSFLLLPSPGEQYAIPKRCCDESCAAALRALLGRVPARPR